MYKIVTNTLKSSRSPHAIQYVQGQFVGPQQTGSRLFLYETLEQAKAVRFDDERIFKVEATGVSNIPPQGGFVC